MAHWNYFEFRKSVTADEAESIREQRHECMKLVCELSSPMSLDSVSDWENGATPLKETPLSLALSRENWDLAAKLLRHIKQPVNTSFFGGEDD